MYWLVVSRERKITFLLAIASRRSTLKPLSLVERDEDLTVLLVPNGALTLAVEGLRQVGIGPLLYAQKD